MKYRYNPVKRTFNLLSAILGIFAAVFLIVFSVYVILFGGEMILLKRKISYAVITIILALPAVVLDVFFLVYAAKLCKKQKELKNGQYESRVKKNVSYIVYLLLGTYITYAAFIFGVTAKVITDDVSINNVFIVMSICAAVLLGLHITYLALPAKKAVKEKPREIDDEAQRFYKIANDLKVLYDEKTVSGEQFVFAVDALADGYIAAVLNK